MWAGGVWEGPAAPTRHPLVRRTTHAVDREHYKARNSGFGRGYTNTIMCSCYCGCMHCTSMIGSGTPIVTCNAARRKHLVAISQCDADLRYAARYAIIEPLNTIRDTQSAIC